MSRLAYTVFIALAPILIIFTISIASIGYLWSMVKPTVESVETQYFDANISSLYNTSHQIPTYRG
jgi:uncharacterized BrkB/YihY/UPF0761 family membrane protein